jgi:hypothetical protein
MKAFIFERIQWMLYGPGDQETPFPSEKGMVSLQWLLPELVIIEF